MCWKTFLVFSWTELFSISILLRCLILEEHHHRRSQDHYEVHNRGNKIYQKSLTSRFCFLFIFYVNSHLTCFLRTQTNTKKSHRFTLSICICYRGRSSPQTWQWWTTIWCPWWTSTATTSEGNRWASARRRWASARIWWAPERSWGTSTRSRWSSKRN